MQSRTSQDSASRISGLLLIPIAALTTFVVGYTASRAHLSQGSSQVEATENYNIVIPHQATLWSDFGG